MSQTTSEKSDIEMEREDLLRAYIKGEKAKVEEIKRKKDPSVKQKLWSDLRGLVEHF